MMRKAVTLTELLIGIAVLSILAGTMSLSNNAFNRQTAKREAERVAAYIQAKILASDRTHDGLWFTIDDKTISLRRGISFDVAVSKDQPLEANTDCSFSTKTKKLRYRASTPSKYQEISPDSSAKVVQGTLPGYRITINGADGKSCDVVIGTN